MKPSKKILMVGPSIKSKGGISNVIKSWIDANLFEEFNITFFSSTHDGFFRYFYYIYKIFIFIFYAPFFKVIYVHTSSNISFYRKSFFIFVAHLYRKKIILHIHPTHFYNFIYNSKGLNRKYFLFILNMVNVFVVLSVSQKNNLKNFLSITRIIVMPNFINLNLFKNKKKVQRSENRAIYLGWFLRSKGVYDLVDAFDIISNLNNDYILYMYGTKGVHELKRYVSKKNLHNKVKVNGWIEHDAKVEKLYESCMLILPSHSEGFPNVILEAMATKTPIISTNVGALKDFLIDSQNSLIAESKNSKELASKIITLFESKSLQNHISINSYNLVKDRFNIVSLKSHFSKIIDLTVD